MSTHLVDTDWAVHFLSGQPAIARRLRALRAQGLALSVVSRAELYKGVHYSRDPQESQRRLSDLLEAVTLLGVDEDTCKLFGEHRGRLRAARMLIGDFDLMIGATALQHDLTLMTNNPSPLRQG